MKNATYVEAARRGSHRWWRYLLGLVIILFAWLVVGTVASLLVAITYKVFKRDEASEPVFQSHQKGRR
ncbi:hypothetical protein [Nostoc edaphicum]|uniref:hypothetical protein n=1 Tax=Nostoc edaphicum TaxID=264686 RepID=UPI001D14E44A|nr:hypothetical protein [Nostoc edaphicum]